MAKGSRPGGGGKVYGGKYGTISQKSLDALIAEGASRWQSNGKDRLYFNGAGDKIIGLKTETYKTGNVRSATLGGEPIANGRVAKVRETWKNAYINLETGGIIGLADNAYKEAFLEGMKRYRKK